MEEHSNDDIYELLDSVASGLRGLRDDTTKRFNSVDDQFAANDRRTRSIAELCSKIVVAIEQVNARVAKIEDQIGLA